MAICEERSADGITVTRRPFTRGEQVGGGSQFFGPHHLGSVTEVTNASAALLARYAFDPWGRRTLAAGSDVTMVGFTGHRTHTSSGLALALYRGYDAGLARWVSEDPIGPIDGPNLYAYVRNRPSATVDPSGLSAAGISVKVGCAAQATLLGARLTQGMNDKTRHCLVSCLITVMCDEVTAAIVGLVKEALDAVGPGDADWKDWEADKKGIACGTKVKQKKAKSCVAVCGQG